jgi:outer membrane protein assembly factor BamB/tRNA A-37 threonylcarbamoyl transferase component Bud32
MSLLKKGGTKGVSLPFGRIPAASASPILPTSSHPVLNSSTSATRRATSQVQLLASGTVLQSRYVVESVLGAGGMSVVYRGRDLRFKDVVRACAIKEMFQSASNAETRLLRLEHFAREAGLLATLSHPAIPKVYDFFEEHSRVYLVMELIVGCDLQALLDQVGQPLSERRVGAWALQICDVLHYLHSHTPEPIIFRDLKPSNIMITPDDRIMLIDFGIARLFQEQPQRGTAIGTEGYAPPEQYRGLADPRGDIYALGATLHHLFTNADPRVEPPFTFHERPIRQLNGEVSTEMEALVSQMLAYDPDRRPKSAADLKVSLQNIPVLKELTVASKPIASLPSTGKWTGKAASAELIWRFACTDEVRSSPALHDDVVFIGSYDTHIYALDANSGEVRWKWATMGGVSSSPAIQGELVIIGSEDSHVYALDIRKGTPRWSLRTGRAVRSSPRIADRAVYVGSDDQHVYAIDSSNGQVLWQYRTWMPVRSSCAIGQDFLVVGSSDGHVYALDLLKGTQRWKYRTSQEIISSPIIHDGYVFVGSMDTNIYALDSTSGRPIWRFRTGHYVNASPTFANGCIFAGSVDGNLYALEAKTGKLVWKYASSAQITSSARVVDGRLYVGGTDGAVYCLDIEDGQEIWTYHTGGPVVSSPVVANEIVYVGSMDRHVYALRV